MFFKLLFLGFFSHQVFSANNDPNCEESLDFWRQDLEQIPEFQLNPCVKKLDLSWNDIELVNKGAFENLPNLEKLDLSGNRIPTAKLLSFGALPKLKELSLNDQSVRAFPNSTIAVDSSFPDLEVLSLRRVGARKISAKNWSTFIPKLSTLDLAFNEDLDFTDLMKNFPPSIKQLDARYSNSRFVNLTGIHNLELIWLDESRFRSLHISDNSTTCKSDNQLCIGWMKSLREISVQSCDIELFSFQYFSFDPVPNLEKLDLSTNNLKTLGQLWPTLTKLGSLDLSLNPFESIRDLCSFQNLTILNLNFILIPDFSLVLSKDVDKCLPSLKELSLYRSNLQEIPKNFLNKLNKLEKLDLSKNQLKKIPVIPKTMRELHLSGNQMTFLQDLKLEQLKRLEFLDISANPLNYDSSRYLEDLARKTDAKILFDKVNTK